jgi:hypothetical protein
MGRATVSSASITRSVKAVASAGVHVGCVEIKPDGTIIIHTVDAAPPKVITAAKAEVNEWDDLLEPGAFK